MRDYLARALVFSLLADSFYKNGGPIIGTLCVGACIWNVILDWRGER